MKNEKAAKIIDKALKQGRKTLSEYEAKQVCRLRHSGHQKDKTKPRWKRPEKIGSAGDERLLRGYRP